MISIQKKLLYIGAAILISVNYTACSQQTPVKDTATIAEKPVKDTVKLGYCYYNNVAKYIAGIMPDTAKAPFNTLSRKPQWVSYAKGFDTLWKSVEKNSLSKIKLWADTELTLMRKETKTLFYPFSGPDFLYANTFYPGASRYYLFGLERTGSIPDINKLTDQSMNSLFISINKALNEILKLSFFITKEMNSNLNNQNIDGVLPVIMLFMARTGNTIKDIRNANIGPDGKVTVADTFISHKGYNHYNKGVEITFCPAGKDSLNKKLYYFPADFTDSALTYKNTGCKAFLNNIDTNVTTLVKSASYLMHNNLFTFIRNTVLSKSKFLLQDDSGIAYRFFDKTKWDIQLYGTYENPIPVFKYTLQSDIRAAYKTYGSKTFNFKYGYGNGRNMLLAKKKK